MSESDKNNFCFGEVVWQLILKKLFKHLYAPKTKPSIVDVEKANYIAVRGSGDPNDENSEYKQSISLLYPVAYAIKMSKKGDHKIPDYFDFVVPPLEGFW